MKDSYDTSLPKMNKINTFTNSSLTVSRTLGLKNIIIKYLLGGKFVLYYYNLSSEDSYWIPSFFQRNYYNFSRRTNYLGKSEENYNSKKTEIPKLSVGEIRFNIRPFYRRNPILKNKPQLGSHSWPNFLHYDRALGHVILKPCCVNVTFEWVRKLYENITF